MHFWAHRLSLIWERLSERRCTTQPTEVRGPLCTIMSKITLSGLYPASTYTVYIRSVNAAGEGTSSTPVSAVLAPTGECKNIATLHIVIMIYY